MIADELRQALACLIEQRGYLDPADHGVEAAKRSSWAWTYNKQATEILRKTISSLDEGADLS